ncbi:hypothetical protein FACS1894189_3730 [Planctomycetales bacterium]|nr:hypothetical protein FACS1894189_3730 [Planctomycetales bacterium]
MSQKSKTYRKKSERIELHTNRAADNFIRREWEDTEHRLTSNLRYRAKNVLKFQQQGYCFEPPPKCSKYPYGCRYCRFERCLEHPEYLAEKYHYQSDPDLDRFAPLYAVFLMDVEQYQRQLDLDSREL